MPSVWARCSQWPISMSPSLVSSSATLLTVVSFSFANFIELNGIANLGDADNVHRDAESLTVRRRIVPGGDLNELNRRISDEESVVLGYYYSYHPIKGDTNMLARPMLADILWTMVPYWKCF